jgi:uncharacterized protein YbaR (Trm112 family)
MPLLDSTLKEVLVCPQCHGALEEDEANARLICRQCRLAYRIEQGIPIMLIEEAESTAAASDE